VYVAAGLGTPLGWVERVPDTTYVTTWLAVIAIATSVQAIVLLVAGIAGIRAYRDMMSALTAFQQQQLVPALSRVHATLDSLEEALTRAKTADADVRRAIGETSTRAHQTLDHVRARFWPVIGLTRGVKAAIQAFRRPTDLRPVPQRWSPMTSEEREARFAYKGGQFNVRK
jgi:hypothetical protein